MIGVHFIHLQKTLVPAFFPPSRVIKEGRKCRVCCPYDPARAARGKIVAYIKPLIYFFENSRLVVFDPFILPHRILGAGRAGVIDDQITDELIKAATGNLDDPSTHTSLILFNALLIQIIHRASEGVPVLIHKNGSLHL